MEHRFIKSIEIDWNKIDRNSYLYNISSLQSVSELDFQKNITFFVGENGTGKSTLLEAIAVAYGFSAEGGTKNYHFSTYDSHSELCQALHITKGYKKPSSSYFLRAESFYNVASQVEAYRDGEKMEIYYAQYGGKSLHQQSHGESFLALVQGSFKPNGLYLLDEPEAALSPQCQLTLLIEIARLAKLGAQFIIASHSPILLGIPETEILSFDDGKIHVCNYTDTESFQVMEMFINHRKYLLERLLND